MDNVSAFLKGPSAHLTSKYGEQAKIIGPLIWVSIATFVLGIVILITVPCSITLLNIGALIASFYAINGSIHVFTSKMYYFWLLVEIVFLLITAFRSNQCVGGPASNTAAAVECTLWAGLLTAHFYYVHKLQAK